MVPLGNVALMRSKARRLGTQRALYVRDERLDRVNTAPSAMNSLTCTPLISQTRPRSFRSRSTTDVLGLFFCWRATLDETAVATGRTPTGVGVPVMGLMSARRPGGETKPLRRATDQRHIAEPQEAEKGEGSTERSSCTAPARTENGQPLTDSPGLDARPIVVHLVEVHSKYQLA